MRKLLLLLLLDGAALAQTTVTATVIDPNGNPYANGTVSAQAVVATGGTSTSAPPAALSAAGFFSITLSAGAYTFTVCSTQPNLEANVSPIPKQVCFSSAPIAISGGAQDISVELNSSATMLGKRGNDIKFQGINVDSGVRLAAAGSMIVVDPTGSKFISQAKPCVDWRDYGITTRGDQSANITSVWNANSVMGCNLALPLGTINIASTVSPSSAQGGAGAGYSVEGVAGAGASGASTTFNWTGSAGATMFSLDRQRDSIIGRFNLNMANRAGVGIVVSQLSGTTGNISSHNLYHDISINRIPANGYGFQLVPPTGDSTQNDEAHTLWRTSYVADNAYTSGSYGFYSHGGANMRSIGQYESEADQTGTGFLYNANSYHHLGGLTQSHNVAYDLRWGNGTIAFTHDEGSKQWMKWSGGGTTVLLNNVFDSAGADATKWQWDRTAVNNTLVTLGNSWGTGATKIISPSAGTGVWISIGDYLPYSASALPDLSMDGFNISLLGTAVGRYKSSVAVAGYAALGYSSLFMMPGSEVGVAGYQAGFNYAASYSLAALYTDGYANPHLVPFRFTASVADSTGTSAATYRLAAPTDPVTGTTYTGPLNFDYASNGNNFAVKTLQFGVDGGGGLKSYYSAPITCYSDNGSTNAACMVDSNISLAGGKRYEIDGSQVGTIASGTVTLSHFSILSGACAAIFTVSASGVTATDSIAWAYASEPTTSDGLLILSVYPTSGNVNFKLCNPTANSQAPSGLTVNWRVIR